MASFLKYTEAFSKQFSDCKWKRRSSKENLVVVLMIVNVGCTKKKAFNNKRVCSSSICLPNAKPA